MSINNRLIRTNDTGGGGGAYIDLDLVTTQADSITNSFYSNSFTLSSDGSKIYFGLASINSTTLYQYSLSTPYNLSTASLDGTIGLTQPFNYATALTLTPDGSKLVHSGYTNGSPDTASSRVFTLNSNFNATAGFSSSVDVAAASQLNKNSSTTSFSENGLYWLRDSDINLPQLDQQVYPLSTAFDLTTINTTSFQNITFPTRTITGTTVDGKVGQFCNGGYQYIAGYYVSEYPSYTSSKYSLVSFVLSTPYDLSTITFDKEKDISSSIADRPIGGIHIDEVTGDIYVPRFDTKRIAHFK
jgi:hypothetical protein